MSKRVTIKEVAQAAGVSTATVSYVLNDKESISDVTKEKVWLAIKELGYVPDLNARGLSTNASRLIGVVVPQTEDDQHLMFDNEFYSEILGSIELAARAEGYHVLVSGTDANENYMRLARERNLDGIIIIGMYQDQFFQQMKETGIPIVLIDSYCRDHYFHNIHIDDRYGSYLAVQHLISMGHRHLAFFCGQLKDDGVMQKRLAGYREGLEEAGIPYRREYIYEGTIDYESGVELAQRLIKKKQPVTGIVAAADVLAIGILKGLHGEGKDVPEDYSLVGFDDLKIARYVSPGLTTVRQDIPLKGKKAFEILLESIDDPELPKQEQILPLKLIERGSVRRLEESSVL